MPYIRFLEQGTQAVLWEGHYDAAPCADARLWFGEVGADPVRYDIVNLHHYYTKPATDDPDGSPATTMCQEQVNILVSPH